jgi:hypothetical protein
MQVVPTAICRILSQARLSVVSEILNCRCMIRRLI